jgi:hypothetical protein
MKGYLVQIAWAVKLAVRFFPTAVRYALEYIRKK